MNENIITKFFESTTGVIYPLSVTYNKGYFHPTSLDEKMPFYLETIVINEGIEEIAPAVLSLCVKLHTIKFPSTLREIGERAFSRCVSLKNIKFPEGLERIYDYAFESCRSIESLIIPSTVSIIGENAFFGCKKLKYFVVLNPELSYDNIGLPTGCKVIRPGKGVETV